MQHIKAHCLDKDTFIGACFKLRSLRTLEVEEGAAAANRHVPTCLAFALPAESVFAESTLVVSAVVSSKTTFVKV